MSDVLRRYLQLQQDLGGDEVIFDVRVDVRAALAAHPDQPAAIPAISVQARVARPETPVRASAPTVAAVEKAAVVPTRASAAVDAAPAAAAPPTVPGTLPVPGVGLTILSTSGPDIPVWSTLEEIADVVRVCPKCPLCSTRTHAVPGEGNPVARLMLVGEGPGESEDLSGRPFVGRAGVLLDKMLESINVPRAEAYIANVVKCRPPRNRAPLPDERDACMPYLRRQIALVQPKVILALGGTAAEALLGVKRSLGGLRLQVHRWNGIPLIVTYHPAALLRNPNWKRPAWDDIRIAKQLLDRDA